MKQQPENGEASFKNLSDEELQTVSEDAKRSLVESELKLRHHRLILDKAIEEKEFRHSGKPKRPPEKWQELWVDAVNEVAKQHGLSLTVAWEIGKKVIAEAEREEPHDEDKISGTQGPGS